MLWIWTACLAIMVVVDYLISDAAEFLNAWSVIERALGREPTAGDSAVYRLVGGFGEALVVLTATFVIALAITAASRSIHKR